MTDILRTFGSSVVSVFSRLWSAGDLVRFLIFWPLVALPLIIVIRSIRSHDDSTRLG